MRKAKPAAAGIKRKPSFRKIRTRSSPGGRRRARGAKPLKRSSANQGASYNAGLRDAALLREAGAIPQSDELRLRLNESWSRRHRLNGSLSKSLLLQGKAYADGYMDGLRLNRQSWLPVPLQGSAAAVVLAGRGMAAEPASLQELMRLPLQEIIVVLEDAAGGDYHTLSQMPGLTIVHAGTMLERDMGRSIGARLLRTDSILFCDGHVPIPAERLAPLLAAVDSGADVALSDTSDSLGLFRDWDELSRVKAFINLSLGRPDLLANSNQELPCAWSAKALRLVGEASLALPPVAQQAAIHHHLNIAVCRNVSRGGAGGGNRRADGLHTANKHATYAHLAALKAAMALNGNRLLHPDRSRRRGAVGGEG